MHPKSNIPGKPERALNKRIIVFSRVVRVASLGSSCPKEFHREVLNKIKQLLYLFNAITKLVVLWLFTGVGIYFRSNYERVQVRRSLISDVTPQGENFDVMYEKAGCFDKEYPFVDLVEKF